jgi:hypothetical protein
LAILAVRKFERGENMLSKLKMKLISAILIILFLQLAAFAYAEGGEQAALGVKKRLI